jgi:GTP-binding protein
MHEYSLPVLAIVGRPNVGKSTIFNALTRTRDALVADFPGVTRDRQYGISKVGSDPCVLVDTGGLVGGATGIEALTSQQVLNAIEEASLLLFVVDAKDGLTSADEEIALQLRRHALPVIVVVNKSENVVEEIADAEFAALGFEQVVAISAAHRHGISGLMNQVFAMLPQEFAGATEADDDGDQIKLAVLGRPNVGKSTLVNRLLGEERVLAFDQPGTTRDTISIPLERGGQKFLLIDTAGVRRRSRVADSIEKFSVIKALQAIESCHVVILMMDASEGMTDQDATLLGHILERGRALVIAMNKWDNLDPDHRKRVVSELDRKLEYATFARRVTMSALHGSGIKELMKAVNEAFEAATREFSTAEVTRVLIKAYENHQPPIRQGRTAKLRYAHSGGKLPPRIIIHGNRTESLSKDYRRYLINCFVRHFKLRGTPLFLEFRDSKNPYKGRRNTLTPRQLEKRRRLKKHVKKKNKK